MIFKNDFFLKPKKIFNAFLIVSSLVSLGCSNNESKENLKKTSDPIQAKLNTLIFPSLDLFTENVNNETLPSLDSVVYHPLESNFDFNFKNHQLLKSINSFSRYFENFGDFTIYYSQLTENEVPKELNNSFTNLSVGFLVFYHNELKFSHVINVENDFYIDSSINMTFSIDEKGRIHILETSTTDGDYNEKGEMVSFHTVTLSQYMIFISPKGEFTFSKH